jgi:hypothetical protein
MCRKMIYLVSLVLILGLIVDVADAATLIGYWNFDENLNDSAGSVNGTFNGGTPNYVAGKINQALEFDGVDDFVALPYAPNLTAYTIALWVKPAAPEQASSVVVRTDNAGPTTNWSHQLRINTQGSFQHYLWDNSERHVPGVTQIEAGVWYHVALTSEDNGQMRLYVNGIEEGAPASLGTMWTAGDRFLVGSNSGHGMGWFQGTVDELRIYDGVLPAVELARLAARQEAFGPNPSNGAMYPDTWVSLSWMPGASAVSHDLYMGENFDDVNDGTGDTFRGNQTNAYYIAGFPGYAYPDGLVPGMTYYWRIDEVNEAEPNSPWKGDVWSFMIPPKTAYYPDPADGAEFVDLDVQLKWTAGFGAKLHYIIFGEDFNEVSNAAMGVPNGTTNYTPGKLNLAKTYYWRVDEFDGSGTYKGEVWSFTTEGAVSGPNPADGAVDVKPSVILSWDAGAVAASHDVYFGTDADAVADATTASPEYKGPKALGEESYDPGKLTLNTTYYWRIDEVNDSPDSPWAGNVWSFTTGDFFVIDDFEDYNADNPIWENCIDGLGYGVPGVDPYFAGNGTGAAVGDETTASTCEETIVHGGSQSMPLAYDNNKQGYACYSEAEKKLTAPRDWTEEGVTELSLWFRGYPASTGSFVEGPVGTYTMTGSGADIWAVNGVEADEFHFAYKMLTGAGSIVAKVQSIENTNTWAKAGVMIRETLDPDSAHAMMVVTPGSGVSFQRRPGTGQTSLDTTTGGIKAPYWVKLERSISGGFTGYSSANGSTWTMQGTENVPMGSNVYIGLALTSHDAALTCQAVFSNVTTSGSVTGQWAHQDIGIASNDAEPLYVAVSNSAGTPAVVVHDDPAAAQIDTWTEWVIPLQALADQGIVLTNVDRIAIGLGTRGNMTIPGGSGKIYIDDIRLYQSRAAAGE